VYVSDWPQRTNEYTAEPVSDRYRQCLFDWLAAHAPLWNQLTYRRRQQYFDEDGDVWDVEYTDLYDDYAPILGKAACQQLARKNTEAWRSFFTLLDKYHSGDHGVSEKPSPPGYWGNRNDGYELHGLVRNDLYTLDWDEERSTLEFGVGDVLEDRYDFDYQERVTLEVRGNPHWDGDDSRLELVYDEAADVLRVKHPVRIQPDDVQKQRLDAYAHTLNSENTTHSAAIDVGANNTLAIVTSTGETSVYHARPQFQEFQQYSDQIGALQSELLDDRYSSRRIQRLYDERGRKRDHSRNAAVKHAAEWLLERNVDTVYVGNLTDVLDTHWSTTVNEKTHAFWSHRQLLDRLELTFGDTGIEVKSVSEEYSSSQCPECGSENVIRDSDGFRCRSCALDAHADVVGAWNVLQSVVGPMARPAALMAERPRDASLGSEGAYWEWNGHDWRPASFGERSCLVNQTSVGEPASSQPG
jgi:putative transposase